MKTDNKLRVINIGLKGFTRAFEDTQTEYVDLNWQPPAAPLALLDKIDMLKQSQKVSAANAEAFKRLNNSDPFLIDVRKAEDVVDGLGKHVLYHAGPPVKWKDMCGPMRGAAIGACIYEGWAVDSKEAETRCKTGKIIFSP